MILTIKHKGLAAFFENGSKAGIIPTHASRLKRLLSRLNVATAPEDMRLPGFDFHPLGADLAGHYAVSVNGNWRLTFAFDGQNVVLLDYQDYH